jgi:hypothetical protein
MEIAEWPDVILDQSDDRQGSEGYAEMPRIYSFDVMGSDLDCDKGYGFVRGLSGEAQLHGKRETTPPFNYRTGIAFCR